MRINAFSKSGKNKYKWAYLWWCAVSAHTHGSTTFTERISGSVRLNQAA